MIVVAARPGHGKSLYGMQWLYSLALGGSKVCIIFEEMSSKGLARRSVNYLSGSSQEKWTGDMSGLISEMDDYREVTSNIFIVEHCGSVSKVTEQIDRLSEHRDIDAVVVDYCQILTGSGKSKYEQVSDISRSIKRCAVKNNIVAMLLAQTNRDSERRDGGIPLMSDLRDSSAIEADADVILFLQWPFKSDPTYQDPLEYRMYVAKNRNRETVSPIIVSRIDPSIQRIYAESKPPIQKEIFNES